MTDEPGLEGMGGMTDGPDPFAGGTAEPSARDEPGAGGTTDGPDLGATGTTDEPDFGAGGTTEEPNLGGATEEPDLGAAGNTERGAGGIPDWTGGGRTDTEPIWVARSAASFASSRARPSSSASLAASTA